MKWISAVMERIFPNTRVAREALEDSEAGAQRVDELVADLRKLQRDNHFSQALIRTLEGR